jgi:acyl-CoA dehydrogenase
MNAWLIVLAMFVAAWVCAYRRYSALGWTAVTGVGIAALTFAGNISQPLIIVLWIVFAIGALLFNRSPIRRAVVSAPLLALFRKILPHVSQTEQEALDAGTVWWDGDLFSGNPDWNKLLAFPKPTLTADEEAFVDGTVD